MLMPLGNKANALRHNIMTTKELKPTVQWDMAFIEAFELLTYAAQSTGISGSPGFKEQYERLRGLRCAADDPSQNPIAIYLGNEE
jgi:hypothetical protein